MPLQAAAGPKHKGWWHDQINNRIVAVFNGVELFDFDGDDMAIAKNVVFAGTAEVTGAQTMTGVTTHNAELRVATGFNIRLGGLETFGSTQPTNTLVIKTGTAPAGAITTSVGLFTDGTTMKKIIAANTVSDVQT